MDWASLPDAGSMQQEKEVGNVAEKTRAKAEGNQPISRHPLFPAIVALWFGALFGLVSLAIKPELIEQIVVASGADSIIPMAAPPLGTTMRILLALAMTGIGAVTGALIALRIANPQSEASESGPRKRSRAGRNSLALAAPREHEDTAFAPFSDAPERKPAREAAILNVSEFDLDGYGDHDVAPAAEPVTGTSFQEAETPPPSNHLFDAYSREIVAGPAEEIEAPEAERTPLKEEQEFPADLPLPPTSDRNRVAERIASAELDTLSQMELLERLALAMAQRRRAVVPAAAAARLEGFDLSVTTRPEPASGDDPEPAIKPTAEEEEGFPKTAGWPKPEEAPHEIAYAPASWQEEPEAEAFVPAAEVKPLLVPAALRPVGHDSPDNDDALPGYVPPRHIAMPAKNGGAFAQPQPTAFDEDEDPEEEDVLEEGYSSLLDLSRSSLARPRFAAAGEWETQAENPFLTGSHGDEDASDEHGPRAMEAVFSEDGRPFDGPGRPDPEETEKALRAALATLQRMSGAA